ncbi:MAG: hypothetical protein J6S61_01885 [Elusimicrobiaceae bacterium]|nr:hypothetical protein [Elusimicrobiaceae bacterium]
MKTNRLIFPGFWFGKSSVEEAKELATLGVGGFCFYGGTPEKLKSLIDILQSLAPHQLLMAADYETGLGRWHEGLPILPTNYTLGIADKVTLALRKGFLTAVQARELGINWVFAPVIDLADTPNNPIVNTRAFSADPKTVTRLARSFSIGLSDGGCLNCFKHFPGHGSTKKDSHLALPEVTKKLEVLKEEDLLPYRELITRADSIMVSHLLVKCLDDKMPASFSKKITTNLLRKTMYYKGLIVTDALTMKATNGLNPVDAFKAGADVLLCPEDPFKTMKDLTDAVKKDSSLKERVFYSISTQEMMVARLNSTHTLPCRNITASCMQLNKETAYAVLQKLNPQITLNKKNSMTYLILDDKTSAKLPPFLTTLKENGFKLTHYKENKKSDLLLALNFEDYTAFKGTVNLSKKQKELLQKAINKAEKSILISFGSPYINEGINGLYAFLPLASKGKDFQIATARYLCGLLNF